VQLSIANHITPYEVKNPRTPHHFTGVGCRPKNLPHGAPTVTLKRKQFLEIFLQGKETRRERQSKSFGLITLKSRKCQRTYSFTALSSRCSCSRLLTVTRHWCLCTKTRIQATSQAESSITSLLTKSDYIAP
jgi:hypothetical protein